MPSSPISSPPEPGGEPVFRAPWEARAFALMVALQRAGVFDKQEWATALGAEIARAQAAGDPDRGDTYWRHWLAALERLVAEKGAASPDALARCRRAWAEAAARTPHGNPIELPPERFPG